MIQDLILLYEKLKIQSDLKKKSLKKKFKDKGFARGVVRDDVRRGAEELGLELWEHVEFVLKAMQAKAAELGLDGSLIQKQ